MHQFQQERVTQNGAAICHRVSSGRLSRHFGHFAFPTSICVSTIRFKQSNSMKLVFTTHFSVEKKSSNSPWTFRFWIFLLHLQFNFNHLDSRCRDIFNFEPENNCKMSKFFIEDESLITQILREIDFADFRNVNSAILTNLEALNFDFLWIFALLEGWNLPNLQNSEPLKLQKR